MNNIKETYNLQSEGPPDYYSLGNDLKQDVKGRWGFGCKHYFKEAFLLELRHCLE
jgi:hypothetical protein